MMRAVFAIALLLGAARRSVRRFFYNLREHWIAGFNMSGLPKGMPVDVVMAVRDSNQKEYCSIQDERDIQKYRKLHPVKPVIV